MTFPFDSNTFWNTESKLVRHQDYQILLTFPKAKWKLNMNDKAVRIDTTIIVQDFSNLIVIIFLSINREFDKWLNFFL